MGQPIPDMHSFDESGVLRPPTWTLQAEQLLAGDLFNDPTEDLSDLGKPDGTGPTSLGLGQSGSRRQRRRLDGRLGQAMATMAMTIIWMKVERPRWIAHQQRGHRVHRSDLGSWHRQCGFRRPLRGR